MNDHFEPFYVDGIKYEHPRMLPHDAQTHSVYAARHMFEIIPDTFCDGTEPCRSFHGVSHDLNTPWSEELWLRRGIIDTPEAVDYWLNPAEYEKKLLAQFEAENIAEGRRFEEIENGAA